MITDDDEGLIRIPCLCSRRSNGSNASVTCILLSVGNKSVVLGVFVQDKHCSDRSDGNGCFKTISHDWTTYWCGDTYVTSVAGDHSQQKAHMESDEANSIKFIYFQ
jgi:hypothetical protein